MSLAIKCAAQTYKEVAEDKSLPVKEVKQDSSKLLLDTYMDDGTTGGSPQQVSCMMGTKLMSGQFSGTVPSMAGKVGLKLKTMVSSGSTSTEAINMLFGAVLRYQ